MPVFFATTSRGLEPVLASELEGFGFKNVRPGIAGCYFQGNWQTCYQANYSLRTASRVLYPVLDFPAYSTDQIYFNVLKHDWTKYISPRQTLSVEAKVRDSKIRDLRIVALKTKDAIVDQFREKFGKRPDVDTEYPDLRIAVRLVKNMCTIALDSTGQPLHERGYRSKEAQAPLKENLGAALVMMSGWRPGETLVDPMCGSGTFCIEASLIEGEVSPGSFRNRFAFEGWKTFQKEVFEKFLASEKSKTKKQSISDGPHIFGYDYNNAALRLAQKGAQFCKTQSLVSFQKSNVNDLTPPPEVRPGYLIVNPPYGERLEDLETALKIHAQLGERLRSHFSGWKALILTLSKDHIAALDIRPEKIKQIYNGGLECLIATLEIR